MFVDRFAKQFLRNADYQFHRARLYLKLSGYSNFNEEQLISKYISELLPEGHNKTVIDIGAGDGRTGSNTYALFKSGWNGVGIEWDSRRVMQLARAYKHLSGISLCRFRVTPDNIVPLLQAYGVEQRFSVLSLDIDGYDYWVLDAILSAYRPSLIITEINEKIPPPIKFRVSYDPDFHLKHHFYGYSIASLEELCDQRGYALIQLEYNNAFLAPIELAGAHTLKAETAYRSGYLERPDRREKFAQNRNMEALLSMAPAEGVRFIKQFFAQYAGRYDLSISEAPQVEPVHRTDAATHTVPSELLQPTS